MGGVYTPTLKVVDIRAPIVTMSDKGEARKLLAQLFMKATSRAIRSMDAVPPIII
jgi:hypothetical protein